MSARAARPGRNAGTKVPPGKKVLNTHISVEEHAFLKSEARRTRETVTHVLRDLVRAAMRQNARKRLVSLPTWLVEP